MSYPGLYEVYNYSSSSSVLSTHLFYLYNPITTPNIVPCYYVAVIGVGVVAQVEKA